MRLVCVYTDQYAREHEKAQLEKLKKQVRLFLDLSAKSFSTFLCRSRKSRLSSYVVRVSVGACLLT